MLVSLGTNNAVGAGASVTFPYACRSVQKIFIKVDDATGATAYDHRVTIQLGSRTICNGVSAYGLRGFSMLQGGHWDFATQVNYQIDLGSHQLLDNENLYVTISAGSTLDAVDVSALVDGQTSGEFPVRYTEYSDNVFTAENVLTAISFDSARADVDEDNANIEIRNALTSSSPNLISCNNWYSAVSIGAELSAGEQYGLLVQEQVPLTTTFNYPSSAITDRILVASQMGTSQRAVRQGANQTRMAQKQAGN